MDTNPDLGVLAPDSPCDYSTPLHTIIEASEEKRKGIQLTKMINSFPRVGAPYFASRPIDYQTCLICENRYQRIPPLSAENAQSHANSLSISDRPGVHNNNSNLQHADNPAVCLRCGHVLYKSCTNNWLSVNRFCSRYRHPVPLPDVGFPKTAINRYMHMGNLVRIESTWGESGGVHFGFGVGV